MLKMASGTTFHSEIMLAAGPNYYSTVIIYKFITSVIIFTFIVNIIVNTFIIIQSHICNSAYFVLLVIIG